MDFSILDDDILPPFDLEAKDQEFGEDKDKICEKMMTGEISNTLTEAQQKRLRVLVQVYGTKCPRNVHKKFPMTLMEILSQDDLQEYISWLPHGRAFCIHQPHAFVNDVLFSYFKVSKFRSFTRQLNLWEFKRISQGRDAGAYYHELFLRGRPKLALFIRRRRIKGIGTKLPLNPSKDPNFYDMTATEPLPLCEDYPLAFLKSTAVKTDDTLPKATEKNSATNRNAASYHSPIGSLDTSNPVHGSSFPQPELITRIEHKDEPNSSHSSRMVLEMISLEKQRQKFIELLQQESMHSLRQAEQALAQHKAQEILLQRINEVVNAPRASNNQQPYLGVPLQVNNSPQTLNWILPTTIKIDFSRSLNLNNLRALPEMLETNTVIMNYPLPLMALQHHLTPEER